MISRRPQRDMLAPPSLDPARRNIRAARAHAWQASGGGGTLKRAGEPHEAVLTNFSARAHGPAGPEFGVRVTLRKGDKIVWRNSRGMIEILRVTDERLDRKATASFALRIRHTHRSCARDAFDTLLPLQNPLERAGALRLAQLCATRGSSRPEASSTV